MPTTQILLAVLNLLLFMLLSKMALKARLARNIAMRLLTDDVYYHETRGVLIQKNMESAKLSCGRVRISSIAKIPASRKQDPQVAWFAAVHTSTHMRLRPLPEAAPSVLEVPYALWATTWASKDTPWSTTVSMKQEKQPALVAGAVAEPVVEVAKEKPARKPVKSPGKTAADLLEMGMMQRVAF
ncbi:hypothetical protein [Undibacterium pigrum]|uniref:Uncharacterized protein n=1 Tax=Undibacterium pigrum TaxID=401470 RepID=A0A318JEV7_9BURK|nr:hypothetical protein [Undibacterium pigrum]PXX45323.1 hypothetical protein DFR42_102551 [Undibacterium pigrum]